MYPYLKYLFVLAYLNCTKRKKNFFQVIPSFSQQWYQSQFEQRHSCVIKMEGVVNYDGDMIKLTTNNYSYWKVMMEDHLIYKDLAEPILNKDIPEGKKENEWKLLNRKAVAII